MNERDRWASRMGLVLAMAGNAIGLGNFLRFPRLAAQYGGGAFLIPYLVALLLLGIPLMWVEWTIGRYGGQFGHTSPGMFARLWRSPTSKYLGSLGIALPLLFTVYYTYIESWTLAYACFSFTGQLHGGEPEEMRREVPPAIPGVTPEDITNMLSERECGRQPVVACRVDRPRGGVWPTRHKRRRGTRRHRNSAGPATPGACSHQPVPAGLSGRESARRTAVL